MGYNARATSLNKPSSTDPKKKKKKKTKGVRSKAYTVSQRNAAKRKTERLARQQRNAEKRELGRFRGMAVPHTPNKTTVAEMSTLDFRHMVLLLLTQNFLRSSCTSRTEIKSMATTMLGELKNADIFEDKEAKQQMNFFVNGFLLGQQGTSMEETMVPHTFNCTADLKDVFATKWKSDPEFTTYASLAAYPKLFWGTIVTTRQRQSDKLSTKIRSLFAQDVTGTSKYEDALKKVEEDIRLNWNSKATLGTEYELEYVFGTKVVEALDAGCIVQEWAAQYGHDLTADNIDVIPRLISSRAVKAGKESIYNSFKSAYSKSKVDRKLRKQIMKEYESPESQTSLFPFSQPPLSIPDTEDLTEDFEFEATENQFSFLSDDEENEPTSPPMSQEPIVCDLTNDDDIWDADEPSPRLTPTTTFSMSTPPHEIQTYLQNLHRGHQLPNLSPLSACQKEIGAFPILRGLRSCSEDANENSLPNQLWAPSGKGHGSSLPNQSWVLDGKTSLQRMPESLMVFQD